MNITDRMKQIQCYKVPKEDEGRHCDIADEMRGLISDAALLVNARIGLNFICKPIIHAAFAYLNDSYALHESLVRAQQVLRGLRIQVDDANGVGEAQRR